MKPTHFVPAVLASVLLLSGCATVAPPPPTQAVQAAITPAEAVERLKEGNQRFASGRPLRRDLPAEVRATGSGQYPFATVVSCLDSRTSSELIFDQGMGDLFNARVAGNIVNPDILGSLEFSTAVAGSKLIAVVGHTKCGAIKGACDHVKLGNLTGLLARIEPAVQRVASASGRAPSSKDPAFVERVAEENVRHTMQTIRRDSPLLDRLIREGKVGLVGGIYDLDSGRVTFLDGAGR